MVVGFGWGHGREYYRIKFYIVKWLGFCMMCVCVYYIIFVETSLNKVHFLDFAVREEYSIDHRVCFGEKSPEKGLCSIT